MRVGEFSEFPFTFTTCHRRARDARCPARRAGQTRFLDLHLPTRHTGHASERGCGMDAVAVASTAGLVSAGATGPCPRSSRHRGSWTLRRPFARSCTRYLRIMCQDFSRALCVVSISRSCTLTSGFLVLVQPVWPPRRHTGPTPFHDHPASLPLTSSNGSRT